MKVSIVIPAYNEEKLLGATLSKIHLAAKAITALDAQYEIIVCDNNSTDKTGEIARTAGARVVFEPVNQIGRARNRGADAATGDWLLFIDADSFPAPQLLADVIQAMRTERYLAGGSTVKLVDGGALAGVVASCWNCTSRLTRLLAGSFIFVETQVFRDLGGFNLELYVSEELELSKRLQRAARLAGKKLVILHRHPLQTSARKVKLYSSYEHLRFLLRAVAGPRRTLRNARACHIWYDGRR